MLSNITSIVRRFLKPQKLPLSIIVLLLLLVTLSVTSGYSQARNINFNFVILLTPYGLVKNLLIVPNPLLLPFYQKTISRSGILDSWKIAALVLLIISLAGTTFVMHFKAKRTRAKL